MDVPGADEARRCALRQAAAESIKPDCTKWRLHGWLPAGSKPQLKHLRAAIEARGGKPRASWTPQQSADWLFAHEPVAQVLHMRVRMRM